ncbi:hypothetical protein Plec18170_001836 [Paecilomyces lecythidis]
MASMASALRQKFNSLSFGLRGYDTWLSLCKMQTPDGSWRSMRDPLRWRPVLNLVEEAVQRRSKKTWVQRQTRASRATSRTQPFHNDLPMEIKYMIVENMDMDDAAKLVQAFCWFIPASYWQAQLASYVLTELQGIASDQLDWLYLVSGMARLNRSPEFWNRRRTIGILKETTEIFWQLTQNNKA